jgi:replicative DNA helicase
MTNTALLAPPSAIDAEQAVLGAILKNSAALDEVVPILTTPEAFYEPKHQRIYDTMLFLQQRNDPVDITTVITALQNQNILKDVGGRTYLVDLIDNIGTTSQAAHYAKIIKEKETRRRIIGHCHEFIRSCYQEPDITTGAILDQWQQAAFEMGRATEAQDFHLLADDNSDWLARVNALQSGEAQKERINTGFGSIDYWLQGIAPGEVMVLGGETGHGKTQFVLQVAHYVARQQQAVALLSLEMSIPELNARVQCHEAGIDHFKVERPQALSDQEFNRIVRAASETERLKIFVNDSILTTPVTLLAQARRLKAKHDIKLLIVDYLQLMDANATDETRERVVSGLSRWMKVVAKEIGVAVIVLSQITAQPGVAPGTHSPRESRAISHNADKLCFVWHNKDGVSQFIIAKQRRGPSGKVVEMTFVDGKWATVDRRYDGNQA